MGQQKSELVDLSINNGKYAGRKLSTRDQEILMASWLCIKGADPQVDYEKLAKILRLKNAHSASTVFYKVKKKVKAYQSLSVDVDVSQASSTTSKAKTCRKRGNTQACDTTVLGKDTKRTKIEPTPSIKGENCGNV
ncbi:hypothetical protein SBRCBS47491_009650 [Sporothrix bragantina]|uniref:Uncharacterized protein n=1 Tax=Sporothrix bragantina TaxID=671064 RepID=A0ABP0CY50_9PEZI